MAKISLDNGNTYMTALEAIEEIKDRTIWDVVVSMMDDDIREQVAFEISPCTEQEFLERYLDIADNDLVIG